MTPALPLTDTLSAKPFSQPVDFDYVLQPGPPLG